MPWAELAFTERYLHDPCWNFPQSFTLSKESRLQRQCHSSLSIGVTREPNAMQWEFQKIHKKLCNYRNTFYNH